MNEQQLADLFSEQIDRLLDGESTSHFQSPGELSDLFNLGQELSQVSFQPGPAAQAAFQTQLTGWFGSPGGQAATILGTPKIWLVSIVVAVTLLGAGLGLIGLLKSDSPRVESDERIEAPVTVELPATNTPLPTEVKETASPEATAESSPPAKNNSTVKDSLPTAAPVLGDTLPTSTPSPQPAVEETDEPAPALPSSTPGIGEDDEQENGDETNDPAGDHDHGHGNDPDGVDEDNPGNSSGLPGSKEDNSKSGDPGNNGTGQENQGGGGDNKGGGGGKK